MDGLSREQAFGLFADLEDAGHRPAFGKQGYSYTLRILLGKGIGAASVAALERVASGRGARVVVHAFAGGLRADFRPREEDAPSKGNGE